MGQTLAKKKKPPIDFLKEVLVLQGKNAPLTKKKSKKIGTTQHIYFWITRITTGDKKKPQETCRDHPLTTRPHRKGNNPGAINFTNIGFKFRTPPVTKIIIKTK